MTPLHRARVYRNVELPQEWFGLEPFDLLGLGAFGFVLMEVNRHAAGWNLLAVLVGYGAMRVLKRGKPEGYTLSLLRFFFARKPFFSAAARDVAAAEHPFPFVHAPGGSRSFPGARPR